MIITLPRLKEISRTFLEILEREKVRKLADLEMLAGQAIPIPEKDNDYLIVEWRPSGAGTRVLDISYSIQHRKGKVEGGIPLDLKINSQQAYSLLIVKTQDRIRGYSPFAQDCFGNTMQTRVVPSIVLQDVLEEVRKLAV